MVANGVEVTVCPPHAATRALEILFSTLPEGERDAMIASLGESLDRDPLGLCGLLIARDRGGLCGAVFAQEQRGKTAVLWPPISLRGDADLVHRLAEAADVHMVRRGIVVAQALLQLSEAASVAPLTRIGFARLTQLEYMFAQACRSTSEATGDDLRFEPYDASQMSRLVKIIEATYANTDDCPELNGVRRIDDVIIGYQSNGTFDPAKWYIVSHQGRDVGVLLLTEHPAAQQWEIVYMALVPQARRRGFGARIVRFALEKAFDAGIGSVLLAVDARNERGLTMYCKCGFQSWDRRVVFWKAYRRHAPHGDTFSTPG